MNISYDSENRSAYLKVRDGVSVESEEVAPGIVFDFDASGTVIGIDLDDIGTITLGVNSDPVLKQSA